MIEVNNNSEKIYIYIYIFFFHIHRKYWNSRLFMSLSTHYVSKYVSSLWRGYDLYTNQMHFNSIERRDELVLSSNRKSDHEKYFWYDKRYELVQKIKHEKKESKEEWTEIIVTYYSEESRDDGNYYNNRSDDSCLAEDIRYYRDKRVNYLFEICSISEVDNFHKENTIYDRHDELKIKLM